MDTHKDYQMFVDLWRMFKFFASADRMQWNDFNERAVDYANRYRHRERLAKDLMLALGDELERREGKKYGEKR